ncbi:MAG: ribonuclease T2 [Paracoccaceae bacterium]|jgi:ribonuclease T2
MTSPRTMLQFARFALVFAASLAAAAPPLTAQDQAGEFDYYILSLSWQPAWCAQQQETGGACRKGAAVGFTMHGLWPQHERGWPDDCPTPERDPTRSQTRAMADIMGSQGLAWHEWKKHGRCSGLSAEAYFTLSREAWGRVTLPRAFEKVTSALRVKPRAIEAAFMAANPGLRPDAVSIKCRDGRITEVRICMERDLDFRICSPDARRDCQTSSRLDPLR